MELELYTALKAEIKNQIPEIKHVGLFNNQFVHSNGAERDEHPFLYPCVFIEFSNQVFTDLLVGVQEVELIVSTHLGFESYKDEDTDILRIKQDLYSVVQRFRNEYFARLTRVAERQDFDHNNIQVYVTDYLTRGKDFTKDLRPTTSVTPTLFVSATTITLSALTS